MSESDEWRRFAAVFGSGVGALLLVWGLGACIARLGETAALVARTFGVLVAVFVALLHFTSIHRVPVELLLVPAVAYALIASAPGRGVFVRALVLGELLVIVLGEVLDLERWRYGVKIPDGVWVIFWIAIFCGMPLVAVWIEASQRGHVERPPNNELQRTRPAQALEPRR